MTAFIASRVGGLFAFLLAARICGRVGARRSRFGSGMPQRMTIVDCDPRGDVGTDRSLRFRRLHQLCRLGGQYPRNRIQPLSCGHDRELHAPSIGDDAPNLPQIKVRVRTAVPAASLRSVRGYSAVVTEPFESTISRTSVLPRSALARHTPSPLLTIRTFL